MSNKKKFCYEYPHPALTVDCVVFGVESGKPLQMLLIRRKNDPFVGQWALPGGFVDMEEDLQTAALRELEEETGVRDVFIEQLYTFGAPGRDPRERVITVAYYALVNLEQHPVQAASDAEDARWFSVEELPQLAFDHAQIVTMARDRLRAKMRYQPIGFEVLPERFTLSQLQRLYETILGVGELNKRNFRTRILKWGILEEVGMQENVAHRPAKLYRFDRVRYDELAQERQEDLLRRGVDFEV